jgi:hypothetical protein
MLALSGSKLAVKRTVARLQGGRASSVAHLAMRTLGEGRAALLAGARTWLGSA